MIWTELSYGSMSQISGNVNHTELIDHAIHHLFPFEVTGATDKDVLTPDPQESEVTGATEKDVLSLPDLHELTSRESCS